MKKRLSLLLFLVSCFILPGIFVKSATAQVTTDGTVNTQVNQNGNVAEITGGETRGGNLFHSFQDFSVNTGNEAFFDNANDISNIFSRVTGGNISSIDGAIRANGSASLFLINPAGIIFGQNASLDIGGSFYGSTADSLLFEDGEFSAVDNLDQPILTINAPIGLSFRDEPGEIINRSSTQNSSEEFVGLEVDPGNTLALIGGNINFERGNATASGGNIELGGLSQAGRVDINDNGSLSFPEEVTKADINLSNGADVDASGTGGGNVSVNARNLNLSAGEFGSSLIRTGIRPESTSAEAQAGDVTVNVAENITLDDSRILNQVNTDRVTQVNTGIVTDGVGNSGNITINTGSIEVINGGQVEANTGDTGDAGLVNITASGDITIDGETSRRSPGFSVVTSQIGIFNAVGNAGGVTIDTTNLTITNGGRVEAAIGGTENAGAVNITASGDITIDGEDSDGFPSFVISTINPGALGNAGSVTIDTANLTLSNGGQVEASTFSNRTFNNSNAGAIDITASGDIIIDGDGRTSLGFRSAVSSRVFPSAEGNGGSVTIDTSNLTLINGGRVEASTEGNGDVGSVNITASGDITIDGELQDIFSFQDSLTSSSAVISEVGSNAEGDAGGVTIDTANLTITNGGQVDTSTGGEGNAGAIDITASGDITIDGETSLGFRSGAISEVVFGAEGDAGSVTIDTTNLTITNGGQVDASTFGNGDAGLVNITASGDITIDGETSLGFPSFVASQVVFGAEGDAGGVTIDTANLTLTNGGLVDASTEGNGDASLVNIIASGDITIDGATSVDRTIDGGPTSVDFPSGATSQVGSNAEGNAGGVTIDTANLTITNGGQVDASTSSTGDAGNVTIDATESIFISGAIDRFRSGISANALNEEGNGGDLSITTRSLAIVNSGTIEATNFEDLALSVSPGTGRPGNISITADSIELTDNARIDAATQFESTTQSEEGESGNIDLTVTNDIRLRENSFISAQARNNADGGNLNIDSRFIIAFPDGNNDIIANAEQGQGGNISINAESLFGIQERSLNDFTNDINASSEVSGLGGTITISTPDINPVQGATELPRNVIEPGETTAQACQANRETQAKNSLTISGKGGIVPDPASPLNSLNATIDGKINPTSAIPAPIETSKGKIQPARGVKVTESGKVILTAYRTNNLGERLPEIKPNCKNPENLPW